MAFRHACAAFVVIFSAASCGGGSNLEGDGSGEDPGDPAVEDGAADTGHEEETPGDIVPDDPDIQACVQAHSGCGCESGCVDGHTEILWYPSDAGGPFPSDINPPPELLAIAVAHYVCSVCACVESWSVRDGEDWRGVDVVEMCTAIVSHDQACGGCLEQWVGGCC